VSYVQLVRPFTLLAPLIAGVFGSLICLGSFRLLLENLHTVAYVAVTLALAQAAGQVINQACDAELDKVVKPYRPIPRGEVTVEEAVGIGYMLGLLAFLRSVTVSTGFAVATTVILFFAFFYNLPPLRTKRFLGVNLLWMSVSRGLLPFIAIWLAYKPVDLTCLQLGTLATIWCLGFQGTKDLPDVEGDLKFGIKTVANSFGVEGLRLMASTFTVAFTVLALTWGYLALMSVVPFAILGILGINVPSAITENTLGWVSFYLGLAFIYVSYALAVML